MAAEGSSVVGGGDAALRDRWLLAVVALAIAFAVLAWRSVQHVNTLWDELNDHRATVALLAHPLWGSGIDGSQARLPMYITALAYRLLGPSLLAARAVSIAVGAITILVTYLAGRRWFGRPTGLLAAGLLAFSPYFLGFSRTALTEGDAFCPLTVLLTVLAFEWYLRQRATRSVFVLATALGVALAAKFYTVMLVPALVVCDLVQYRSEPSIDRKGKHPLAPDHRRLLFMSIALSGLLFAGLVIAQLGVARAAAGLWLAGSCLYVHLVRAYLVKRPGDSTAPDVWPALRAWLMIVPLAAAVCLVLCPEHVVQPEVARAVLRRLVRQDHVEPMATFIDPVRLYLGVVLLKLGLPLGLLTAMALVWAWFKSPHAPILRLLLAMVAMYTILLTALPLRQPFYMMSVYPLLVLILAAFIVRTAGWLRGRDALRSAWIAVVATSCLYLGWGLARVWPDFNLYGYETVGNRWLGAESRGHRNLVQVTNDGTEDALRWCTEHVWPGARVVSYLWDDHVIDAFVDRYPLRFEIVRRFPRTDRYQGPPIEDADYLIVSLNNEVSYHDRPSPEALAERFGPEPVYTVYRGRGVYRLPVVRIYQRRSPPTAGTGCQGRSRGIHLGRFRLDASRFHLLHVHPGEVTNALQRSL